MIEYLSCISDDGKIRHDYAMSASDENKFSEFATLTIPPSLHINK